MADSGMTSGTPARDDPRVDGEEAVAAALAAFRQSGHGAEDAARRLLEPLASEAGRCWAANEWSPGREQSASAAVDVVRALLVAGGDVAPVGARVPVVVAAGEWHLLPARLAALFLRLRGWDAAALAALPLHALERSLTEDGEARAVVVSCAVAMNLPGAAHRVAAAHAAGLPALAVGPGFGPGGAWARSVGADEWVPATAVGQALDRLPPAPPFASAVVPHPEVGELRAHRAQVVDAALAQLLLVGAGRPDARPGGGHLLRHRRCLAGLARTLEAALFVGDDDVMLEHVRWSITTTGPADEPPELIAAAVASLAAVVRAPRAAQLLAEAEVRAAEALAARHRRVPHEAAALPDPPPSAPVGPAEGARIAALRGLRVLDTAPEARFDDLTRVAAAVCATPMAGLGFVDAERVWLKSALGDVARDEPRITSPAAWAIAQHEPLVVPDAAADRRFAAHPTVAGEPHLRFWAGAPVVTRDGHPLAALFVADTEPRRLRPQEYDALRSLAGQVANLLELRAHELDLDPSPGSVPVSGTGGERARLVRQLLGDPGGPDRLLRTREVALLFDVSERTVNYWASQGRLPSRQTAGGHRRYASRDVLQLFQSSSQLLVEG